MIPDGNHTDWPWPASLIPRKWTAIASNRPPKMLLGNVPDGAHLDIPPRGTWALVWPLGLALTTKTGWHVGLISRYDYNDRYYNFPRFTVKHYQ